VVEGSGITLDQLVQVLQNHKKGNAHKYLASESSVEEFRDLAIKALSDSTSGSSIIVNYHMATLGQGDRWGGHHSPLAAYHKPSDMFLILDTWPYTNELWATAEDIFCAMNTTDGSSNKSRGYCVFKSIDC